MFGDALAIVRYHIVLVAMAACLVFAWLENGTYVWGLALVVGVDWFLINLLNRVTDVDEDLANGIRGTERVSRSRRAVAFGAAALLLGSFVVTHWVWPTLTPWRLAVQAIGMAYNYRLIPTFRGLRRFKEIYFLKNFMSAVLFVLTCFVYPHVAATVPASMSLLAYASLAVFFVPFELTYEVLYDLRDLEGDRQEGVPTYPVVHGVSTSLRIVEGLLAGSVLVLLVGLATGVLGAREGLMLAAPAVQWAFVRARSRKLPDGRRDVTLTSRDCIWLTHLGTGLLLFYLAGTAIWRAAGLPANVYLVG
jgi:4-hydroxybenzoate polyprenyltransferase